MGMISRVSIAALATLGAIGLSQPASAAGSYVYVNMQNQDIANNIAISNVKWSGSYNPQLPATITPMAKPYGVLKTVFDYGYSTLEFDATITPSSGPVETCHFSLAVQNSTGAISYALATHVTSDLANCTASTSGINANFSMSYNAQ